jgi:hypothetical protein
LLPPVAHNDAAERSIGGITACATVKAVVEHCSWFSPEHTHWLIKTTNEKTGIQHSSGLWFRYVKQHVKHP